MLTDAFDADVLIYAVSDHPAAPNLRAIIFGAEPLVGSLLLLPETLSKPLRSNRDDGLAALLGFLDRIDLKPVDLEIAAGATEYGAKYRLKAADAIHLATAVVWGAERFHTNNRKDFGPHIDEVEIVWAS